MPLRLQVDCAKGLLVLGQVLAEHIPQSLGLLRAEKDGLWLRIVTCSGLSFDARPKTSWKSSTLMRTCTLLA